MRRGRPFVALCFEGCRIPMTRVSFRHCHCWVCWKHLFLSTLCEFCPGPAATHTASILAGEKDMKGPVLVPLPWLSRQESDNIFLLRYFNWQ